MDEHEQHVAELESKTEQISYEFVQTELATCFSSVDTAVRELEQGHREAALEEAEKAEKGYKTIVGYIAKLSEEGPRIEIQQRWTELRASLDALQAQIQKSANPEFLENS